jgi:dipeptidyl aminopeptidase/acylaminoacyl peptidase
MLPEVWVGPLGTWKQLTHVNSAVDLPLPKFDNISWKRGDFNVQGWLLYPRDYDPAKRYPMMVAVHGGPAWIATPTWRAADFNATLFTNFAYFVFFPNARGSYGQGEKFTQANRRDWGFGDLQDMLSGVDTVIKRYSVDATRVGLLGWSYGGSTAMMAITQTNRLRAAVAGAGAGNWQSYYGQNSIDKWMISYFGASVYDDPAAYARCSAITYIKKAKTPTLVLVGERDGEAPPAQSLEFWHALKELGVTTQLVIYANEGHSFFKEADRIDVTLRTLEWFDQHMNAR